MGVFGDVANFATLGIVGNQGTWDGVGSALGLSGVDLDQGAFQETPEERDFINELKASYRGERPSYAKALLDQSSDKSMKQAMSMQTASRTASPAASSRYIESLRQQQMADVGQQTAEIGAKEKLGQLGMIGDYLNQQKTARMKGALGEAEMEADTMGRRQKFISGLGQGLATFGGGYFSGAGAKGKG
jgi:hypothetical protein